MGKTVMCKNASRVSSSSNDGWSNLAEHVTKFIGSVYSCCMHQHNKGPFTPSASTSVYTSVDARLRPSTSVDARLRRYGTHAKNRARSHQARLRPSTDVDGRLRPSTPCWSSNGKRPCGTRQGHEYSIHKIMEDETLVEGVRRRNVNITAGVSKQWTQSLKTRSWSSTTRTQFLSLRSGKDWHYCTTIFRMYNGLSKNNSVAKWTAVSPFPWQLNQRSVVPL